MRTKLMIVSVATAAAIAAPVAHGERPDDRAGMRGPGAVALVQAPAAHHPDNRASARGPGALDARLTRTVRPDDRAGARGPGSLSSVVVQQASSGFDWNDAALGGLGGAGLVLLLAGCFFVATTHRHKARPA